MVLLSDQGSSKQPFLIIKFHIFRVKSSLIITSTISCRTENYFKSQSRSHSLFETIITSFQFNQVYCFECQYIRCDVESFWCNQFSPQSILLHRKTLLWFGYFLRYRSFARSDISEVYRNAFISHVAAKNVRTLLPLTLIDFS